MEDLQRSLKEKDLTILSLSDKGRCIFTTRDFNPGEVIISEKPYVWVPKKSDSETKCDGCFVTTGLKKCSACQFAFYCGSTCQKEDWKFHRVECGMLSKLDKMRRNSVTPTIRLMLRLYMRRKLEKEKVIPATPMENYELVEALVSHMSDIDENQLVLFAQMANLVNLIIQSSDISLKEVAENFSKFACNAHTICDSEFRPLGTGLFPVVSIINHSCLPNAVLVFEGRSAVVRAVQHIAKDTEVSISYIETAGSTMIRQKALREQYYFTCKCPCCIKLGQPDDIKQSAILEGYRCKNNSCDGFLLRDPEGIGFNCQLCGHVRNKEEIKEIASEIKSLSNEAVLSRSLQNCQEAVSNLKMIEKLQMELCHHFSISLMQTREKLLKMFMELQNWNEALIYCRLTIPVYKIREGKWLGPQFKAMERDLVSLENRLKGVYPGFHPLLGLQYYTCGKLEWLLGDTENAVKSLTKAVDILRFTHGTSTPFMKELLTKLDEARAEASYKLSYK